MGTAQGQGHNEFRPFPGPALDPDAAAEVFDDPLADREPQAAAAGFFIVEAL